MAQIVAISDSGYEILCKLVEQACTSKMLDGRKHFSLDMTPYTQAQLQKLKTNLQKTLTVTH